MLILSLLGFLILVALSAFFSSAETALVASGEVKLDHLAGQGSRGAARALRMIKNMPALLGTILVGNNLVNVMAAALATSIIGPVLATVVVTLVLLIFAEITPKTLAAGRPERFAQRIAAPIHAFTIIFKPVVWTLTVFTDVLLKPLMRGQELDERKLSRHELLTAIKLGARDGELEPSETRMTKEVLTLKDKPVRKIMIPIDQVKAIPEDAGYEEVLDIYLGSGFTRYPILSSKTSASDEAKMVGMLLVKDLVGHHNDGEGDWRTYIRPLMHCRPELEADELLRDMQIQASHMAVVEDEQGRQLGLVTMEDVLEEIVGEIQDEYDDEVVPVRELGPNRFIVHGDIEVDDLCKVINADLGDADQQITLAEWFERRLPKSHGRSRRVEIGNALVFFRGHDRFEIRVKTPPSARRT